MRVNINSCCICNKDAETVLKLKFKEIVGLADDYVQDVRICNECGLIYTANPFSNKQLADRYKNYSKFEYDSENIYSSEAEKYKKRCLRQKQFIQNNINDFDSILEVGASSGYNLSLYSGYKTKGIEPSNINCKSAKKNYNIDMFCGMFDEFVKKV